MELQDVKRREISPFFDSLGREKELVMMTAESVMASDFVAGIRSNRELAGLTGIRMQFRLIPSLFIVVKDKYQGMGLGNKLLEKNIAYARSKYNFLTLDTWAKPEYGAALHLYKKHGFKLSHKKALHQWFCISFNKKGDIFRRFLPLMYTILPVVSHVYSRLITPKPKG
jgi:GNAT superfamily N-acetyltransferase